MIEAFPSVSHRRTAAELLARSIQSLFPEAVCLGGGLTDCGFYYDFGRLPALDPSFFPTLEQTIRLTIKQKLPIVQKEMVRDNAADFLDHRGLSWLAQEARDSSDAVVSLFSMDDFLDLCPGPFLPHTGEVGELRILSCEKIEEACRIEGVAFPSLPEMKYFLKRWKEAQKRDPIAWAEKMRIMLSTPEGPIWLPKGILWKGLFQQIWDQSLPEHTLIETPARKSVLALLDRDDLQGEGRWKEWKRDRRTEEGLFYRICLPAEAEDALISSLHFIHQTINIFGIGLRWVFFPTRSPVSGEEKKSLSFVQETLRSAFRKAKVSFREEKREAEPEEEASAGVLAQGFLLDFLGREKPGPSIRLFAERKAAGSRGERESISFLAASLYGPIDRWVSLLIEQWADSFPLWLAPEQLRFLPADPSERAAAEEGRAQCAREGVRAAVDLRPFSPNEKARDAAREGVPWVAFCGQETAGSGKEAAAERMEGERTFSFRPVGSAGQDRQRQWMSLREWKKQTIVPLKLNIEE